MYSKVSRNATPARRLQSHFDNKFLQAWGPKSDESRKYYDLVTRATDLVAKQDFRHVNGPLSQGSRIAGPKRGAYIP